MTRRRSKKVGARELKTRLGTYLREVREGATIVVTERGQPVAELRPLGKAPQTDKGLLDQLVVEGSLTRASSKELPRFTPLRSVGKPISQTIVEDREERL
jgi:prevent-host-death family protein